MQPSHPSLYVQSSAFYVAKDWGLRGHGADARNDQVIRMLSVLCTPAHMRASCAWHDNLGFYPSIVSKFPDPRCARRA